MNRLMYIIGCLLLCVTMVSQSYQAATEAQKKEIIDKITQASTTMKTMRCDFTQEKELSFMNEKVTSEGKMFYKQPDKIRWEYTKPQAYVFAMDGKDIFLDAGSNQSRIPARSSRLFSGISDIIIGGISGVGLIDSPDFTSRFSVGTNNYLITLTPLKKEIQDLFANIQLYVNQTDGRITEVELIEKGGDKTLILLKSMQTNVTINDEVFSR